MPGRRYSSGNSSYRYGFNGKENDKDAGEGIQDYGMRVYDRRLGRFLSVDPLTKTFPFYSPYHYAGNSPIKFKDLDGGEPQDYLENWITQTLYQMSTGKKIGTGSWVEITSPTLGRIDVKMVYDKWTKKCWFIHEGNDGNYYYLKNDDGNSGNMHVSPGKFNNFLTKGEFQKFETQNRIQGRLGGQVAEAIGMGFAMGITAIVAAPVLIEFGAVAVSAVEEQALNIAARAVLKYGKYIPVAVKLAKTAAEFADESGQTGSAGEGVKQAAKKFAFGFELQARSLAAQIKGSHLMDFKGEWKTEFFNVISDTKNEIHFSLDGFEGTFMENVLKPRGNTNYELNLLYQIKEAFERTIFHFEGKTYQGAEVFNAPMH